MANRKPRPRASNDSEPAAPKIVVRDRRRVDPVTGTLRPPTDVPAAAAPAAPESPKETPAPAGPELEKLTAELAERTSDLKRVSAEYANYRKRTERERETMADQGAAVVIGTLLPVLDDIERAREHGDLTGGFAGVAEQLISTLTKLGLAPFAEEGDAFDPTWHEAVAHSGDGTDPHVVKVLRKGYALGERMLRPALVVVGDAPETPGKATPAAAENAQSDPEPTTPSEN